VKEEITKEVQESTGVIRYIWIVLGAISFGLGSLGVVLPLLPTVPFYLFAVFCFARGSKRFHEKFVNSKLYANYVEPFKNKRGIPLRTKINILMSVSILLGIGAYGMRNIPVALYVMGAVWIGHVIALAFIVKTAPPDDKAEQ
jgi:hypothetical protein